MRRIIIALAILAAIAAAFVLGRRFAAPPAAPVPSSPAVSAKLYQCSMHPQIISDKPGKCPICGMNLEPVEESTAEVTPAAKQHKILFYRHPMRPDVTSPTPRKDEMGMDYIPVYEEEMTGAAETGVPGHGSFTLSAERQQLIGVTRGRVDIRELTLKIRTVGTVAYDPDLYQALIEYRNILNREAGENIVKAGALKLRQMGLSEELIRQFAEAKTDPKTLLLPGKEVWVYARIFEYELDLVHTGQSVEVSIPSLPGRTYTAKIIGLDSVLDAMTRTVRARVLVETPDESLRPETFVHVKLEVPLGKKLSVPFDAVLDTGEHQIVFAVKGAGTFEPRSAKLGRQADGFYEVLSGLEEGEEVVTSANFLIDSESRFRSAVAAFKKTPPAAHRR
jgi:Cu(I)/Ag(I) efflux system membrane fusion protein